MGFACGKCVVVMVDMWFPAMMAAGDLDRPFATKKAIAEVGTMSVATIDRVSRTGESLDAVTCYFHNHPVTLTAKFDRFEQGGGCTGNNTGSDPSGHGRALRAHVGR